MTPTGPTCQSCGAEILWRVTEGRRIPLDREPSPDGVVLVALGGVCRILSKADAAAVREKGQQLWMPHHATCPTAGRHRVPRAQLSLEL